MSRPVHYMPHSCGPQECDCNPVCRADGDLSTTQDVQLVSCRNCLRSIEATKKRRARERTRLNRSFEAWANECAT